jgi:hypothetical protein
MASVSDISGGRQLQFINILERIAPFRHTYSDIFCGR